MERGDCINCSAQQVLQPMELSVSEFETLMRTSSEPVSVPLDVKGSDGVCDFQSQSRTDRQFVNVRLTCVSLRFRNMGIKGRLILAGHQFLFENCVFFDVDSSGRNPIVEIVGEAWAKFVNCEFRSASKCAIAARNKARAVCTNCLFHKNTNCVIVTENAAMNFDMCEFVETERLSVYSYKGGSAWCRGCSFKNCDGKAVVAIKNGKVAASQCEFDGMKSGALVVSEKSQGIANGCKFTNVNCAGVVGIRDSSVYVYESLFEALSGNAIQFQNATGIAYNVTVNQCRYPAIVVTGQSSNPVIMNARIGDAAVGIGIRDFAVPHIIDVEFDGIGRDAFSISDFSRPVIRNCSFFNVRDMHYRVFNGAVASVEGDAQIKCSVFHEGRLVTQYDGPLLDPELDEPACNVLHPSDGPFDFTPFQIPPKMGVRKIPLIQLRNDVVCADIHVNKCCVNCGKETDFVLSSCGHRICEACAEQARLNGVCPLCNTAFQDVTRVFEQERCCVCFENPCTTIMMPCGHKCLCTVCALNSLRSDLCSCPVCSTKLKGHKIDFTYRIGVWPFPEGTSFVSEE